MTLKDLNNMIDEDSPERWFDFMDVIVKFLLLATGFLFGLSVATQL